MRRSVALTSAIFVAAASAAAVLATPASAADTSVSLPLTAFRHIVVDDAHGHVFLTGGGSDGIVVRNLDGTAATVIADNHSPDGLALSPDGSTLYVALSSGDGIGQIDTTTLTEGTTISTGANTCPHSLAPLGTKIWFGYGCTSPNGGIGVVDLSATPAAVTLAAATESMGWPALAYSPQLPGRIFAGEYGSDPGTVQAYDIGGAGGTTLTSGPSAQVGENFSDMAITADGADIVTASGYPYVHPVFKTADLSADGQYGTNNPYPVSVATSSGGDVAAGLSSSNPDINIYTHDGTLIRSYGFGNCCDQGQPTELAHDGLAFGADGTLYAVTADYMGATITLRVLPQAVVPSSTMTLTGPATGKRVAALALTGSLSSLDGAVAGAALSVSRADLAGAHALSGVQTDGAGDFSVADTPTVGGANRYTVSYAGDATHRPVSTSFTVQVSRVATTLTVQTSSAVHAYHAKPTITAHLGTTYNGRKVSIYAQSVGGTRRLIKSGTVDRSGNLLVAYLLSKNTTFTATFAGDYRYAAKTAHILRKTRVALLSAAIGGYANSGGYRLYHHGSTRIVVAGKVAPSKTGNCLTFQFERYVNGTWSVWAQDCFSLDSYSEAGVWMDGVIGRPYRIRVVYASDGINAAATGPWVYAKYTG